MRIIASILLLVVAAVVTGQDKAGKSDKPLVAKFTIGKETTYVTGPLGKDGYIDYVAALNERLRKGVTPDNNAVVLLLKALGPRIGPDGEAMPEGFYQWLGIAEPPENGTYFDFGYNDQSDESEEFVKQMESAQKQPWRANQHPRIASWLNKNEKPLAIVVEATRRPQYFYPVVPTDKTGLLGARLWGVQQNRAFAHALIARSMLRLGEGRLEEAWNDLLACHRLGRLVVRGVTLVEYLVGIAIDRGASDADIVFLHSAGINAGRIRDCLRGLGQLPQLPAIAPKIDLCNRFELLNSVMLLSSLGIKPLDRIVPCKPEVLDPAVERAIEELDLDHTLRTVNRWYDRLVKTLQISDRALRNKELASFRDELMSDKLLEHRVAAVRRIAKGDRKAFEKEIGEMLGDILVRTLLPRTDKVLTNGEKCEQQHRNVLVAFALAIYQREHSRYPKTLDELAPKYLAEVPLDLFSGKPLVYLPSEKDYLLYSVGPNGQDDQGRTRDDNPAGDDLAVRMPLPKP